MSKDNKMVNLENSNSNKKNKNYILETLGKWGLLIATFLIFIMFSFLERQFLTTSNIFSIVQQAAITGLLALGLTTVVVSGEFDLSFPSIATLTGVVCLILASQRTSLLIVIPLVYILGIVLSSLNYFLVVKVKIPAFIATLGTMGVFTGIARFSTGGTTLFPVYTPSFMRFVGRGFVLNIIPTSVVTFAIASIILIFFMDYFYLGRYFYAVGGNPDASIHVGIDVNKIKFIAYVITGITAATAGITSVSMLGAGNPEICSGYMLPAISAVFMGGVFLRGGLPNIWGTVIASVLMAMLANGFIMLGFPQYVKEIVQGSVLVLAVAVTTITRKGKLFSVGM
jgi:ribose/xylose/arabinose/galactoside ABC-type transport system permease subunit